MRMRKLNKLPTAEEPKKYILIEMGENSLINESRIITKKKSEKSQST